jgi:ABC-type nitrate/sulfonate/bicarbonate transport system permease component
VYLSWKQVRRGLIVSLIVLAVYTAAWYLVAQVYGWEPFPRWSTIASKLSDFKPTADNFYDGIRFTLVRIGQGLKKVVNLLREGRWRPW